jgi:5'-3' exonuclease
MDCKRDEIWRRTYLPTYKGDRDEKQKKYSPYQGSWKLMYEFINDHLLPAIESERGSRVIRVPHAECDDIIGVAMSKMKDNNNIIISSDHDYIQLSDKALVVTPQGEPTLEKTLASMEKKFGNMSTFDQSTLPTLLEKCKDPEVQLDIKILVGDKSDCIAQVFERHGPLSKAMTKLILDDDYRERMFIKDPEARKRYDFNKRMIDMRLIPNEIKRNILIELKKGIDRKYEE